jgi:hypothetical protein
MEGGRGSCWEGSGNEWRWHVSHEAGRMGWYGLARKKTTDRAQDDKYHFLIY